MRNKKCAWAFAASVVAVTPFVTTAVTAAGIDGSTDVVCGVIDIVGCAEDGGCVQGTARSFDLPRFMILDAKQQVVRAAYESGDNSVSPVKNMEHSGDYLVLQGVENSRGWTIAIDSKSGKMSASLVGDAVSFLALGACTAL